MKKIIHFLLAFLLVFSISCDMLDEEGLDELTTEEVINGLKTALAVGTDSSTSALSAVNGYYGNSLLRIPLPPEAEALRNTINGSSALNAIFNGVFNIDEKFEDVIKSVNHAASDAAKEAAPIFKQSITELSITDAWDILNGINPAGTKDGNADFDSTAATNYFKSTTSTALTSLYAPKINNSLDKPLFSNFSATDAWNTLTSTYNDILSSAEGQTAIQSAVLLNQIEEDDLPDAITTDLGEFCTGIALNGLFHKVGEEEKKIRKNPLEWAATAVGDILKRVFGGG